MRQELTNPVTSLAQETHVGSGHSGADIRAKLDAMDWLDHGIGELLNLQPTDAEGRYILMLYISGYIIAHGHNLSASELNNLRAHAAKTLSSARQ